MWLRAHEPSCCVHCQRAARTHPGESRQPAGGRAFTALGFEQAAAIAADDRGPFLHPVEMVVEVTTAAWLSISERWRPCRGAFTGKRVDLVAGDTRSIAFASYRRTQLVTLLDGCLTSSHAINDGDSQFGVRCPERLDSVCKGQGSMPNI